MIGNSYRQWNTLNHKEKNILLWNPMFFKALPIKNNAVVATEMATSIFGSEKGMGKGDKKDAFRHAFWMALNAQSVGKDFSQKWGDAHEYSTPKKETHLDLYMDIHNNDVGIEIGINNPNATPEQLRDIILDKMNNGDLIIINKDNNPIKSNGCSLKRTDIRREHVAEKIANQINQKKTQDE